MLEAILTFSVRRRGFVLLGAALLAVVGALALRRLDVDAFPDTTPVQVQVNTVAPALSPEQVELQITAPVEQAISGLPGLAGVRSVSKFGLSQVVVTFADGTDVWFARRLVSERLAPVVLPPGIAPPELGPVATGLGEIFHYVVTSERGDLVEARTVQDWVVAPALRAVPGVAEVTGWGGYEKQYQVRLEPSRLVKHGLTLDEVSAAVRRNNVYVGGGSLSTGGDMLLVQGLGGVTDAAQLGDVVVASKDGVPIRVRDLGAVEIGHEIRRGAVTYQGRGEAVLGLGFLLMGENAHEVAARLGERLDALRPTLPEGVDVTVVYDRTELVDAVLDTVRSNLFHGGLLVVAVLFLFLGHLRAGLVVASAIPLSMVFAFSGMLQAGIAGSLMSLGALDFGLVVDSAVIQVENAVRHLRRDGGRRPRAEVVREAAVEVRRPTMFGELVIVLVYVPILLLEGVEGKLFRPMALTVVFALVGSLVLSLTVVPALSASVLPRRARAGEPWIVRALVAAYRPVLAVAIRQRTAMLVLALALLLGGVVVARGLGSEFVPRLSEGAIVVNVVRLAGTDLSESVRYGTRIEQALLAAFPDEIEHVWTRIGSAEVATDPMGVELSDVFLTLRPRERWTRAATQDELTALVMRELRDMPGQRFAASQPIEMRMNEMIAGARGDVVVSVFGDDLDVLAGLGQRVADALASVPGAADVSVEQLTGQPVLEARVDQDALARFGIPADAVMDVVESLGSKRLGEVVEGQLRFPLVLRLAERHRRDAESVGAITVSTAAGQHVPLRELADLQIVEGPSTITREWGQRRVAVQANVRGRDVGGFVADAQAAVARRVALPPGGRHRLAWGGQFEHLERARQRLLLVVPAVLLLIGLLLYATYGAARDALRVFTGVPFAALGGVVALWVRGMPFSISAAVGFVALSGVAVLGDMVLVSTIKQLRAAGLDTTRALEQACLLRLRPVLMTALVAALGFLPMATSTGVGAEVQRPLATVVVGGVLSSTLLTLVVLPAVYLAFARRGRADAVAE